MLSWVMIGLSIFYTTVLKSISLCRNWWKEKTSISLFFGRKKSPALVWTLNFVFLFLTCFFLCMVSKPILDPLGLGLYFFFFLIKGTSFLKAKLFWSEFFFLKLEAKRRFKVSFSNGFWGVLHVTKSKGKWIQRWWELSFGLCPRKEKKGFGLNYVGNQCPSWWKGLHVGRYNWVFGWVLESWFQVISDVSSWFFFFRRRKSWKIIFPWSRNWTSYGSLRIKTHLPLIFYF